MGISLLDDIAMFATASPYLAIVIILLHYALRRARWRRNLRKGRPNRGFCPSTAALGIVFLITQVFTRPGVSHMVQVQRAEDADEDDQGDPEAPMRHLRRQLRRIRRGQPVDTLLIPLRAQRRIEQEQAH